MGAPHEELVLRMLEDNIELAKQVVRDYRGSGEEIDREDSDPPVEDLPGDAPGRRNRAFNFRMTEDTLARLRKAAEREDRSIQWIFDRVLLRALDDHESKS